MNLSQLYYFRRLAQLQHYTKTAKELYITQPSLSDSIASLEKELGILLFQKEGRNVKLTKEGEEFYHYVCAALNELEKGIDSAKEKSGVLSGVIEIGCIPTLCGDFLPRNIDNYVHDQHSKVKFNVYQHMSLQIVEGVKQGYFDIGFCSAVDNEPDLIFTPLFSQEIVAIINDKHSINNLQRTNMCISELKDYDIITYRDNIPIGKSIKSLLEKHNVKARYSYDGEILIGGQVSILPVVGIVARTPLLQQFTNINYIKLDVPNDFRLIYMVTSKKNYKTKAVESYINYIQRCYNNPKQDISK